MIHVIGLSSKLAASSTFEPNALAGLLVEGRRDSNREAALDAENSALPL